MIPGTALGVLVGDLLYTWLAFRLAKKSGRTDVTAMPLGLDTPSTIGIALVVLGPVFLKGKAEGLGDEAAALVAWQVGMAIMIVMGVVKLLFSFVGDWVRRTVPAAGLLGSLGGIGLALLGFFPLQEIFRAPVVGLLATGVVIYGLLAGRELPGRLPAAFAAVFLGAVLYHVLGRTGGLGMAYHPPDVVASFSFPLPTLGFWDGLSKAIDYLPVAIPFGLLTIVGGVNVTESARMAGDDYATRDILLVEAFATLIAGICGGVAQSTPYIGHPAYKRMGGRAGYTLFAGIFVGLGGMLGMVQFLVQVVPQVAVTPILLFIGLEILSQSFRESPARHAGAVGLALLPSVAELVRIVVAGFGLTDPSALPADQADKLLIINMLGHGFIITALLWGAIVAEVVDGKRRAAGAYLLVSAVLTLVGLIHSASPTGGLYLAWQITTPLPLLAALGYALLGLILVFGRNDPQLNLAK
jgi:AGZA family xanthine/uracil permease-like MFS transporter